MTTEAACPKCSSANVVFSKKRGAYICEDSETRTVLDEAAKHGFVLILLSHLFLKTEHCQKDISNALQMQGNIIPITIEKFDWSEMPPPIQYISYLQFFDLTIGLLEERIEELIKNLKTREME